MNNCGISGLCPNPEIYCEECEYYIMTLFDDEDEDEDEDEDGDRK